MTKSKIRMHPERSVPAEAQDMLAQGRIAHFGFIDESQPYVIPLVYYYDRDEPDAIYIHSASHGRAINVAASGSPLCLTVTEVDARVYGPSAVDHSLNYRSVMVFGTGALVMDATEKERIMHGTIARYFDTAGNAHQYEPVTAAYLAHTSVVRVAIENVSAKARRGGPRPASPEVGGTLPW